MTATRQVTLMMSVLVRQYWVRILAWVLPLVLLLTTVGPAYEGVYPTLGERAPLISTLESNVVSILLYGPIGSPGTIGQLIVLESGAYALILGGLMAILLTINFTRQGEDDRTTEHLRAAGMAPWVPTVAGTLLSLIVSCLLGIGIATSLSIQSLLVEELTLSGAWSLGLLVASACAFFSAVTAVLAQVFERADLARRWAMVLLAAAFLLRMIPDAELVGEKFTGELDQISVGHWLSPIGWKHVIAPYTADRMWPLWIFAAVTIVLIGATILLAARREYQSGLIRTPETKNGTVWARSSWSLSWYRNKKTLLGWGVTSLLVGAIFGGLSTGMVEMLIDSPETMEIMRQIGGDISVLDSYYSLTGIWNATLIGVFAILMVLRTKKDETYGLLDAELGTGQLRPAPFLAAVATSVLSSAVFLGIIAFVTAGLSQLLLSQPEAEEVISVIGEEYSFWNTVAHTLLQFPAVALLAAISGVLLAYRPNLSWLAWLVLVGSSFLAMMGGLFDLPQSILDTSIFIHVPDIVNGSQPWWPLALYLVVAAAAIILMPSLMRRRDIPLV